MQGRWTAGDSFGRYELRASLGKGGMGEVFEAYDREKDRVVALKLLDDRLAGDEAFRERFRRESHAAARLSEPHVIPIHDWGTIDGTLYIDMRLVRGTDVRGVLRSQGPLDPARAVYIIEQIAAALDAAHAEGLIHRDVKPDNVLLTSDDFAYLVDFGIVQVRDSAGLTSVGNAIGTVASMAPERFDGRPATPATDIYSLGCLLVECLTGETAFRTNSIPALLQSHLNEPPPRLTDRNPSLPVGLDDVVATAMAKDPSARYATAGDLARAARHALSTPPRAALSDPRAGVPLAQTAIAPMGYPRSHTPSSGYADYRPSTGPAGDRPPGHTSAPIAAAGGSGGRRWAVIAAVVLLVIAAAVGGWWWTIGPGGSDGSTSPTSVVTPAPGTSAPTAPSTSDVTTDPTTTAAPSPTAVTTTTTPTIPPLNGTVPNGGERGFTDGLGPQCLGSEFARAIGASRESRFLICENSAGDRYYNGLRLSDGTDIQLPGPVEVGEGIYQVVNPTDGTTYRIGPAGLVITVNGEQVANETASAYAYRE